MCLVALAIDQSRRYPLVIAANRDETYARATQRLGWWSPDGSAPEILGGRDLQGGGTWLGLTLAGRLALVTNVRDPARHDPQAPSRGRIVADWLRADQPVDRYWMHTALAGYNGFNLLAADFRQGDCYWANNTCAYPLRLGRGLYGVSNAALDTPWPKVTELKRRVAAALPDSESVEQLAARLFEALADRRIFPDETLPGTGVPLERERLLSAAFIQMPDADYGTRSSTLLITERTRKHLVTHVLERSFSAGSPVALLRQAVLRDWPPRYEFADSGPVASGAGEVTEAEVTMSRPELPPERRRHRTLLAPRPLPRAK